MAGVNPALTQSLLEHVKGLRDEGMSVIFVEHDMDVVHDISDWVVVMAEGRVIAEGTPRDIGRNQAVIDAYLGTHHGEDLHPEIAKDGSTGTPVERLRREPMSEVLLQADDLVAGYVPEVNILNGCSLELYPAELVGIIGPNGAGKSTLLKAIFGLIPVRSGGHVRAAGRGHHRRSRPTSSSKQGVGFVPQTENVFASLTVQENMEMGAFLEPTMVAERFDEGLRACSPASASGPASRQVRSRVASARWWRWVGR